MLAVGTGESVREAAVRLFLTVPTVERNLASALRKLALSSPRELGEVLAGMKPGRTSPGEITLFESLGLGIEDLAAAAYLYERCVETGAGTWVTF